MYILANSMSSSGKCLFRASAHFLIGFVFLMLAYITFLYILGLKVKACMQLVWEVTSGSRMGDWKEEKWGERRANSI